MKKLYMVIFILLFLFVYFLFVLYNPKDYETTYKIKEYFITEKYVKDLELYEFYINHDDRVYPLILDLKYNKNRKNIKNIQFKNNDDKCIYIIIRGLEHPVCYENNTLIHHSLTEEKPTVEKKQEFKNIIIYNYDELNYYIWNYKGFDFISEKDNESIQIFKNDNYENLLSYIFENYIVFPNYDEKYFFKELYTINIKNNKVSKFNLNEEISYFSNFMGHYKRELYLLDKKNEKQYKINPKKQKIRIAGSYNKKGIILNINKLEKHSIKTMINKNLTFNYLKKYNYELIDGKLYLKIGNHNMLVSNNNIKEIVQVIDDKALYLSNDILYSFTPNAGEKQLLQNKEWNFNYQNKIFVFNKE